MWLQEIYIPLPKTQTLPPTFYFHFASFHLILYPETPLPIGISHELFRLGMDTSWKNTL